MPALSATPTLDDPMIAQLHENRLEGFAWHLFLLGHVVCLQPHSRRRVLGQTQNRPQRPMG